MIGVLLVIIVLFSPKDLFILLQDKQAKLISKSSDLMMVLYDKCWRSTLLWPVHHILGMSYVNGSFGHIICHHSHSFTERLCRWQLAHHNVTHIGFRGKYAQISFWYHTVHKGSHKLTHTLTMIIWRPECVS